MEPKKIKTLRELQMEKYKLKVSMEYTQKRLGDNWSQVKNFFTPEHLAFEAGRLLTSFIAPKKEEAPKKALPKGKDAQKELPQKSESGSTEVTKTEDSPGSNKWLMILMPFLVGALSALLQAYGGDESE